MPSNTDICVNPIRIGADLQRSSNGWYIQLQDTVLDWLVGVKEYALSFHSLTLDFPVPFTLDPLESTLLTYLLWL